MDGSGRTGIALAHGSTLAPGTPTGMDAAGTAIDGAGAMDMAGAGDMSPGATLMDGVVGQADDGAPDMAGDPTGGPEASCARTSAGPHRRAETNTMDPAIERRDISHLVRVRAPPQPPARSATSRDESLHAP
jgi:hypothetical protein